MSGTDGPAGRAGEPRAGAPDPGDGPAADSARLAEEIRLLVDLVTERAEPWLRSVFAAGHGRGDPASCAAPGPGGPGGDAQTGHRGGSAPSDAAAGDSGTATGGDGEWAPACSWCPLCAVISVARGETPEITARVLEQAAALIALLRAVLADRWQPDEGVHMPGYRPSSRPGPAPAGFAASGTSVFAERPGRGAAAGGPARSREARSRESGSRGPGEPASGARRVQRVPVRPRESWEPGE
ncbi:hypothetical protein GCM10009676_02930 [Prauserella halophila]|uniref:Uncharacterized protein n=1 Tax=Prauserella halophila TaxID=185641 RepID=A0ABP4GGL5_9PSEU|nr:hypothetical protein [Prauserella halophila]MCP2234367.1 hypothetical protein [Prauserella halophila]